MSAAPRPVTSTVTKQRNRREETLQRSLHELSRAPSSCSSNSTSSLCSVLDHDSYESVSGSSSGDDEQKSFQSDGSFHKKKISLTTSESVTETTAPKVDEKQISAWETWLISKEKLLREKTRAQTAKEKEEARKKQEEEQEKKDKLKKAESVRKEWLEHKNKEDNVQRQNRRQKQLEERQAKESKAKDVQEKSKEQYREWKQHKLSQEKERRAHEKQLEDHRLQEENEKRRQSEAAFEEWCRKAQTHPKPLNSSFGYTCGKLTGYHDRGSNPIPGFYNPIPWKGPDVSAAQKEKKPGKKKTVKYKWDPNKYY